jgi:hypothetical protein
MDSSKNMRTPVKIFRHNVTDENVRQTTEKEISDGIDNDYTPGSVMFSSIGHDESRKATLTPGPVYIPGDSIIRKTPGAGSERVNPAFEHSFNMERRNSSSEKLSIDERQSMSPRGDYMKDLVDNLTNYSFSPRLPRDPAAGSPYCPPGSIGMSGSLFGLEALATDPPHPNHHSSPLLSQFDQSDMLSTPGFQLGSGRGTSLLSRPLYELPKQAQSKPDISLITSVEHKAHNILQTPDRGSSLSATMSHRLTAQQPVPQSLSVLLSDSDESLARSGKEDPEEQFFSPGKNIHSVPFYPQSMHPPSQPHAQYMGYHGAPDQKVGPSSHFSASGLGSHSNDPSPPMSMSSLMPPRSSAEPYMYHQHQHQHPNQHFYPSGRMYHPAGPPTGSTGGGSVFSDLHHHSHGQGYPPLPPGGLSEGSGAFATGYSADSKSVIGSNRFSSRSGNSSLTSSINSDASSVGSLLYSSSESKEMLSERPSSPKPTHKSETPPQVESPVSKSIYKNFSKIFKTKETESVKDAVSYAQAELPKIPDKIKWRVYIDLADTLKRNSLYDDVSEV